MVYNHAKIKSLKYGVILNNGGYLLQLLKYGCSQCMTLKGGEGQETV